MAGAAKTRRSEVFAAYEDELILIDLPLIVRCAIERQTYCFSMAFCM
jgi:hypothetical protein